MNKVIFPLVSNKKSPAVRDLQNTLFLLLKHDLLSTDDEKALRAEQRDSEYGAQTTALVREFQQSSGLRASGNVDKAIADALDGFAPVPLRSGWYVCAAQ
jgi:peptidoglycan hydrolase-like protein with peptidoglycan-binding domain